MGDAALITLRSAVAATATAGVFHRAFASWPVGVRQALPPGTLGDKTVFQLANDLKTFAHTLDTAA
jgi:hypothetical protein